MPGEKRAFTLIELLIVVAIIAILAALAVPNFLEAQTRSKVARARADMRTVVTALEVYRVDRNDYPTYHYSDVMHSLLHPHVGGRVLAWGFPDPAWDGLNPLTTPVAYITTMPLDPFAKDRGVPRDALEYFYTNWNQMLRIPNLPSPLFVQSFRRSRDVYGDYRLHSRGPDAVETLATWVPYDPTNGTTSYGDITYGPKSGDDVFYVP